VPQTAKTKQICTTLCLQLKQNRSHILHSRVGVNYMWM